MNVEELISKTVEDIKESIDQLQTATHVISSKRIELEKIHSSKNLQVWDFHVDYWRFVGVHDALSKFLEFSSSKIDDANNMEIAQKARYFCDSMMWVKHLSDPKK